MKKDKCLIYGCGKFFQDNIDAVREDYFVIDVLDRFSENTKLHNLEDCEKDFSFVLIMIEKIKYVFESIYYLMDRGIEAHTIILGISKYSIFGKNIEMHITFDRGICIIAQSHQGIVYNEKDFWHYFKTNVVLELEAESRK